MNRWVEHIEAVSSSVNGASRAVNVFFSEFLTNEKIQNLQSAKMLETLTARISQSSNCLADCLTDLSSMALAVEDAMLENPDVASSLTLNILSTFVKQLLMYYKDTSDSFQEAADVIFGDRSVEHSTTSLTTPPLSIRQEDLDAAGGTDKAVNEIPHKHLNEGRKKSILQEATEEDVLAAEEMGMDDNEKGVGKKDEGEKKIKHSKLTESLTSESNGEFNVVAVGEGKTVETSEEIKPATSKPVTQVWDAEYLQVITTVEEALGPLVLSAGPNVFTAPETILQREPIATYYVSLAYPGCLGPLLHTNYVALDEDMQADFMCDVLRSDYVEVEPFSSPAGEVVVSSSTDLRGMPACAWRISCSEDRQQMLYTMYILTERGPDASHSLLVRDVLLIDQDAQEEVLHVITALTDAPQFAKVSVYSFVPASSLNAFPRKHARDRISALVNITKSTLEKNGYAEVNEAETRRATPRGAQRLPAELLAKPAGAAFRGTVELAPLGGPSPQPGWGLGDIAKGAARGAAAVVKAPVVVTKAVGSAVLDVSGVSGAIKSQTEGWFRKSFPQLAHEEIIDAFHCALVEEGNPIPKQGCLFITPHWLCFQSSITQSKFNLEWDEIKDVQKNRTIKLIENAISIDTHLGGSYFLTSFMQRDQAFGVIMKQWLRR